MAYNPADFPFRDQMALWSSGVSQEIAFWTRWVKTRGDRWPEDFNVRIQADSEVGEPLVSLIDQVGPDCKILDVGAGPMTFINKMRNGHKLSIDACDPLANAYNMLLDLNKVTPPVRTRFADAEHLSAFFPASYYDLSHCRNALDHSLAPLVGIVEMLRVTKVGGKVVLIHGLNEAVTGNYEGLHQHNFDIRNDRFVIWNKSYETDVEQALPIKTSIEISRVGNDMFAAVFTKLEEFSDAKPTGGQPDRHAPQLAMLLDYVFDLAINEGLRQLTTPESA